MQPPITAGTVLQNRYRIQETLGQGGFGRTYLAEDSRRFNELCAIKELIPTVGTGTFVWEKTQELFQREAAILYQIQHPQVPQFRERFEQDQRLFLVQDYVAGKTYRALLDERKAVGGAFTEKEVLQLIRSLLPVLEHIHTRGIIHRDISPENIILRASDAKPVLIDFGVVKELATKLNSPDSTKQATYVGKLGYSPSEQLQTGQAYPSSDLYALAVSAVVLLTGFEPAELFDDTQLTWNWQRWVTVNGRFAAVLNRMLSYRPSDRYQNATQVAQALQSVDQTAPTPDTSNLQTVAVGRRPDEVPPPTPNRPNRAIPEPASSSVLDNPLALGAIGSAVVILAGFGSWALVSSLRSQQQAQSQSTTITTPQDFPSPVITGNTAPTPTPTPTTTPEQLSVRIEPLNFGSSNTLTIKSAIKANEKIQYTFIGQQDQQLTASLADGKVLLTVLAANGEPIDNAANEVLSYQGTLPAAGNYTIEVSPLPDVPQSEYNLTVTLENPVQPTPTPTPTEITPTPTPTPTPTEIIPTPTPATTEIIPTPTPATTPTNNPPVEITPNPPQ